MPTLNFTARGIATLKPPKTGRIEFWDKGMPGFGIRITSTGSRSWIVMYRFKGRKRRHTLGAFPAMTLADAYSKARTSLNEAVNGKDPAATKKAERIADTFGELADEYLTRHAMVKKKSWKGDERHLERDLLPFLKNQKANEISRRDIIKILDGIVERGAPIQANRVLALVRKIFNFAITRDIVEFNPCAVIPLPGKPQTRDRVLNAEEIQKVWLSAERDDSDVSSMIKLRLLTAQRGGEIETMAWDQINLNAAIWTIPAELAKNGLAHRVPLNKQALKILKSLDESRTDSPWVFPGRYDFTKHIENVQKAVQRIRTRKGFEVEFTGHDLRRTAASHMARMKVPRLVISKILNHVESGVTAVYDRHGYDDEKREALQMWGKYVDELVSKSNKVNKNG